MHNAQGCFKLLLQKTEAQSTNDMLNQSHNPPSSSLEAAPYNTVFLAFGNLYCCLRAGSMASRIKMRLMNPGRFCLKL